MLYPIKMKKLPTIFGLFLMIVAYSQSTQFNGIYSNGESFIKFWNDSIEFKLCRNGGDGWYCNRGFGKYYIVDSVIYIKTISPLRPGYSRYREIGQNKFKGRIGMVFYNDFGKLHDSIIIEIYGQKFFRTFSVHNGFASIDLSLNKRPEIIRVKGIQGDEYCLYDIPINQIKTDSIEVYLPKYSNIENEVVKFDYIMRQDSLSVRWSTKGYKPPPIPLKTKIKFVFWCMSHTWPWNYGKCELKRVSAHTNNYFKLKKN